MSTDDKHGCGTVAGYVRHKRALEAVCAACKVAWAKYYRDRRLAKSQAKKAK